MRTKTKTDKSAAADNAGLSERAEGGVRSLQLAVDILEVVWFSGEELGVTQLADRLGVTKGSVHRHLTTFVDRGYLVPYNPLTTRYGVGPKCRAAGFARARSRHQACRRKHSDARIARPARPFGGAVGDDAARRARRSARLQVPRPLKSACVPAANCRLRSRPRVRAAGFCDQAVSGARAVHVIQK